MRSSRLGPLHGSLMAGPSCLGVFVVQRSGIRVIREIRGKIDWRIGVWRFGVWRLEFWDLAFGMAFGSELP